MAAVDLEIADAVVTALEAATLSKSIDPIRSYAEWDEALEEFDELHVDVVPLQTGPTTELDDRGSVEYACEIDIGVRYRFGRSRRSQRLAVLPRMRSMPSSCWCRRSRSISSQIGLRTVRLPSGRRQRSSSGGAGSICGRCGSSSGS